MIMKYHMYTKDRKMKLTAYYSLLYCIEISKQCIDLNIHLKIGCYFQNFQYLAVAVNKSKSRLDLPN